jgi:RTX calcium-binding nonapeptide repeat (4 copies)
VSPALAERPHISTIKAMPTLEFLKEILGLWMVDDVIWAKAALRNYPGVIRLSDIERELLIMTMQEQVSRYWETAFQLRGQASCSQKEALEILEGFFVFLAEQGVVVVSYKASGDIVDPQDITEFNISPPDDTLDGPATRQVRPTKPSDDGGAGEEALTEPSDSEDSADAAEENPSEPSEPARNVGIATPRTNAFIWPHVMITSAQVLASLAIAFVRTTASAPRGIDPSFTQDLTPSPSNLLALDKNNPVETVTTDTCSPVCQEDKPSRKSPHSDDPQVDMTISFEVSRTVNANAETQVFATNLNEVIKVSLEGSFPSIVDGISQLFSSTSDPTHAQQLDPVSTVKNAAYLFSDPANRMFLSQNFNISMVDQWETDSIVISENDKPPLPSTYSVNVPEIATIIPVESKSLPSIDDVPALPTENPGDRPLDDHPPITDKGVNLESPVDLDMIIPDGILTPKDNFDFLGEEKGSNRFSLDAKTRSPMKIYLSNSVETHIVGSFGTEYARFLSEEGSILLNYRDHFFSWRSWAGDLSIINGGLSTDSLNCDYTRKPLSQAEDYKKSRGVKSLSTIEISGFTGVGRGSSPSSSRLLEIDTLQFIGSGLTARYLQMEQQNQDVVITFEGNELTKVTLKNINLDEIDNLDPSTGSSLKVGNIIFDGDESIKDNFDVFNSDWYRNTLLNENTTTFLNNLDNFIYGFDNSDDVINGQGGNDTIFGLSGNDLIRGGSGDDILNGGLGHNQLVGNTGNDIFVIVLGGMSDVMDFTLGQDKIQLSEGSYTSLQFEIFAEGGRGGTQIRQSGQVVGRIFGISSNLLTPDQFVQQKSFDRPLF